MLSWILYTISAVQKSFTIEILWNRLVQMSNLTCDSCNVSTHEKFVKPCWLLYWYRWINFVGFCSVGLLGLLIWEKTLIIKEQAYDLHVFRKFLHCQKISHRLSLTAMSILFFSFCSYTMADKNWAFLQPRTALKVRGHSDVKRLLSVSAFLIRVIERSGWGGRNILLQELGAHASFSGYTRPYPSCSKVSSVFQGLVLRH